MSCNLDILRAIFFFLVTGMSAEVLEDYPSAGGGELNLKKGDVIVHMREHASGYWIGRDPSGKYGLLPSTFVQFLEKVS